MNILFKIYDIYRSLMHDIFTRYHFECMMIPNSDKPYWDFALAGEIIYDHEFLFNAVCYDLLEYVDLISQRVFCFIFDDFE